MANLTYFKKFSTKSDYDAYIDGTPVLPNVSIVANEDAYFKDGEGPEPPHDYSQDYLTFEFFGSGTLNPFSNLEYSIDNGQTWNEPDSDIVVDNGTKVLFRGNTNGNVSSSSMFYLTGDNCYFNMYGNIMSIINSTGFTTATTLQSNQGFTCMFADAWGSYGADKLLSAENLILPATTLENGCYQNMFWNCTSLTTAPALPATTLADGCYSAMFKNCTSLTTAPELPATTLTDGCYSYMFERCTSLNYIKCLATNISASECTLGWVDGVSSTGTFVKNTNMSSWTTGSNGIPANWTIQDA